MEIPVLWLRSFLLTILLELPVFALITRKVVPFRKSAAAGAAGTCITHPLLWFVWPLVVFDNYTVYLLTGEALVVVIESFTYHALARPVSRRRAFSASLCANALSASLGLCVLWFEGLL